MANDSKVLRKNGQEKTKKSGRARSGFNLIDLFIIILLLCCVVLIAAVYVPGLFDLKKGDSADITYVIEFEGVRPDYASFIKEGDAVNTDRGYDFGTVCAGVEVTNHNIISYDPETGDVIVSAHPTLSNLLVTVAVSADSDPDTGYSVAGKRLAVGTSMTFVLPGFTGEGVCIAITEGGSNQGGDR